MDGLHLARAVGPPPRLRAKWIVFSAPLRSTLGGSGWAFGWRFGRGGNLRNPARVGELLKWVGDACRDFQERCRKRVIRKYGGKQMPGSPEFIGVGELLE